MRLCPTEIKVRTGPILASGLLADVPWMDGTTTTANKQTNKQTILPLEIFEQAFVIIGHEQSSIKCCSAAAPLRAEQGPCEPSEDVVRKFGEQ